MSGILTVSPETYDEIAAKLREVGFIDDFRGGQIQIDDTIFVRGGAGTGAEIELPNFSEARRQCAA